MPPIGAMPSAEEIRDRLAAFAKLSPEAQRARQAEGDGLFATYLSMSRPDGAAFNETTAGLVMSASMVWSLAHRMQYLTR